MRVMSASCQPGCSRMMSTDFRSLVSPIATSADPHLRRLAAGGRADTSPASGIQHHVHVVMVHAPPLAGALAHVLMMQKKFLEHPVIRGALARHLAERHAAARQAHR